MAETDMTAITKDGLRACIERLLRQSRPCHWGDHYLSEKVELRGVDGSTFMFSVEGNEPHWRAWLRVPFDDEEEDWSDAFELASQTCNLMGWSHDTVDNVIMICPYVFNERLEVVNKSTDVVSALWRDLMAVLQSKQCGCGRARTHSTDAECSLCLLEGTDEDRNCPICWNSLPVVHFSTCCCNRGAHLHCLERCENRCFNCRTTPLAWKRT